MSSIQNTPALQPLDSYNQVLMAQVHPPDWVNPPAAPLYDLVVMGAGTAGLVVAAGAAGLGLGLKIALVERSLMGGDCLNVGCVPSKCVIRSSRAVADIHHGAALGVSVSGPIVVDFAAVMERMRRIRSGISHHDSVERFQNLGIDVFLGQGQFIDRQTIALGDTQLRFKKAVIATGAAARIPAIPGLPEAGYLTNETVFSLTTCPKRLGVIGGGPIGCELAQALQRLGSQVSLFHTHDHVLDREDEAAAQLVQTQMERDGVHLLLNTSLERIEVHNGVKTIYYRQGQTLGSLEVDTILVAAGRRPNVDLNLEAAGVTYDDRTGVWVNDYLQTSNPKIYAAGDVCLAWKFTHAADAAARLVIKNALFAPFGLGRSKVTTLTIPWVTYTDPEIAHVGLYEHQAQAQGLKTNTITIPWSQVDRALADGETEGFVKILHSQESDRILGATIVARHGGEMINTLTLALVAGHGLSTLSTIIHPYPTQAEAIKKAADAYRRTLLTPRTKTLLTWLARLS